MSDLQEFERDYPDLIEDARQLKTGEQKAIELQYDQFNDPITQHAFGQIECFYLRIVAAANTSQDGTVPLAIFRDIMPHPTTADEFDQMRTAVSMLTKVLQMVEKVVSIALGVFVNLDLDKSDDVTFLYTLQQTSNVVAIAIACLLDGRDHQAPQIIAAVAKITQTLDVWLQSLTKEQMTAGRQNVEMENMPEASMPTLVESESRAQLYNFLQKSGVKGNREKKQKNEELVAARPSLTSAVISNVCKMIPYLNLSLVPVVINQIIEIYNKIPGLEEVYNQMAPINLSGAMLLLSGTFTYTNGQQPWFIVRWLVPWVEKTYVLGIIPRFTQHVPLLLQIVRDIRTTFLSSPTIVVGTAFAPIVLVIGLVMRFFYIKLVRIEEVKVSALEDNPARSLTPPPEQERVAQRPQLANKPKRGN